jgi:transcriptional regulator with XRE-family HTH domain
MSLARHFGDSLRRHRGRIGLSQEEFAARVGVHRTEISLIERGLREPRLGTLIKLADSLGVSIDDLRAGIIWRLASQTFELSVGTLTDGKG